MEGRPPAARQEVALVRGAGAATTTSTGAATHGAPFPCQAKDPCWQDSKECEAYHHPQRFVPRLPGGLCHSERVWIHLQIRQAPVRCSGGRHLRRRGWTAARGRCKVRPT